MKSSVESAGLAGTAGIVAVSGGPDSVALARMLADLGADGLFSSLCLAHLNHQLRGEESDADEAFVLGLPAAWGGANLRCRTERMPVRQLAGGDNLENAARELRYGWLTDVARQEGARWIATGHTADDQAETVLFRLLRGTGLKGLAGMRSRRELAPGVELVRPMLNCRRRDILAYLEAMGQSYREDSSNRDLTFTRNRLRLELLPLLAREYQSRVVELLCQLGEQAREVQQDVDGFARQLLVEAELPRAGAVLVFARHRLRQASSFLVCEMFRLVWQREGWPERDMSRDAWLSLTEVVSGKLTARDYPGGIQVCVRGAVLQVRPGKGGA